MVDLDDARENLIGRSLSYIAGLHYDTGAIRSTCKITAKALGRHGQICVYQY